MTDVLKVGIVGCGRIASEAHLPCYQMIPDARVVGVMDVFPEKAKSAAQAFQVSEWYSDYEDMLRNDQINAIDICSPPDAHAQQAIAAAEAGKHILCEKPISTNMRDAQRLKSTVRKAGVTFMTGFAYRFHPLFQRARMEVEGPRILRINYSFRPAVSPNHWIRGLGGGFIIEQAVHWFDLYGWWSGKAKKVYASGQPDFPSQIVVAVVSYENDSIGLISCNTNSALAFFHFVVENPEKSALIETGLLPSKWGGLIQINERHGGQRKYTLSGPGVHKKCRRTPTPLLTILPRIQDCHLVPFYNEIEHFVFSVLHGCPPITSLGDGLESLRIAIAAIESIRQGKEIQLS